MHSWVIVHFRKLFVVWCLLPLYSTHGMKYLLYTVNENEGFNLRRDVYVRIANLLRCLDLPLLNHAIAKVWFDTPQSRFFC